MLIVGITGTDGAGKGSVVDYLVGEKHFVHYSARALITEEIKKRNFPVDRDHTRLVANELRKEHGPGVIAKKYIARAQAEQVAQCVIESVRSLGEAKEIKENGGLLLAVDADQQLRYRRNVARGTELDQISFEKFQAQEELEMNDPDPHGMQKAQVMKIADYTILNNGTLEELHAQVDEILAKIESNGST